MATQQEVIKAFMKALDVHTLKRSNFKNDAAFTTNILDFAVKACSSFGGVQKVINQMLVDQKKAGNADTFLKKYCGINLANTDTGAITGKDAGGSKVKTAASIVPENSSPDENFEENSFTVNGLTVKLGQVNSKGETVSRSYDSLSTYEKYLWHSLYSNWIESGLDLIAKSYGDNFSFKTKSSVTKTLYVVFADEGKGDSAATYGGPYQDQKSTNPLKLHINLYYYSNATGADGIQNKNNKAKAKQAHLDRTVAHELTHSVMRANIDYYDYLPALIKEGTAELTHGIDDENKSDLIQLAGNATLLKKALVMSTTTVDNVKGVESPSYSAGYMFLRYLAKQAATGGAYAYNKSVSGTSGKDSINNFFSGSTIQASGGNDTIRNYASSVTIDGGAGNDRIINEGSKVSIYGGNGADSVYNDSLASNVSIFAGTGADSIFNHAATVTIDGGNDADYISNQGNKVSIRGGADDDTIKNWSSNVTIDGGNDDDRIYNYASSTVTLSGGDGADYIDNSGAAASMVGGNGNDTLTGYNGADTLLGVANDDKLYGNNGNDKLYGGNGNDSLWGGAGNDSLWGGKGNDSLWGNSGADTFIYANGDGKDMIFGFENGDMLKITGNFSTSYNKSKKEIYFKVGSTANAITLKNFGSTSTFNVNGTNYKIGSSSLVKK